MHRRPYFGYQGYQKRVSTKKKLYYWPNMKNEIVEYLTKSIEFQQVSVEHQYPPEMLQPLPIP